jgi:hypothetical protein
LDQTPIPLDRQHREELVTRLTTQCLIKCGESMRRLAWLRGSTGNELKKIVGVKDP